MRRLLLIVSLVLLFARPSAAAITAVQGKSDAANDVVVTFAAAPSAANVIWILGTLNDEAQTLTIDGWATAVTTVVGPIDSAAGNVRTYLFCAAGDGFDTSFTGTSSGNATTAAFAVELTNTTCSATEDDSEFNDTAATTSHSLTTDLTTTAAGDVILGVMRCATASSVTAQSGTLIEDTTSNAAGQYQVVGAAGSYDTTFTTAANEDCLLVGVAITETVAASGPPVGSFSLYGVGR